VAWGYYWSAAKPVLTVQSGDTVTVECVSVGNPTTLEAAGLPADQVEADIRRLYAEVPKENKGPGGHPLTGPIAIEGAMPGDVLEVRIKEIRLRSAYAFNSFGPGRGFLPDDFTTRKTRIIPLDREKMIGHFAPGIDVPLRPFFGSMGVAPPEAAGKISSAPPGIHAGNMDNKELVAGTTLFIPVHAAGALFEVGDRSVPVYRAQRHAPEMAARRDADALHHHGHRRGPDRGDENLRARDARFPGQ
jgi:acetamidase/formamidase